MLDHIGIDVSNLIKSKEFYLPPLKLLGYECIIEYELEKWIGFAIQGEPDFWIHEGIKTIPAVHIAFRASSRILVDKFYETAIAAGGRDNGTPEIRHKPNNYCAYILDPDGHDIEVMCQEAE